MEPLISICNRIRRRRAGSIRARSSVGIGYPQLNRWANIDRPSGSAALYFKERHQEFEDYEFIV
jgi:hypothetical protein